MNTVLRVVLGWVWWLLLPIRRAEATANLAAALPHVPPGPALRRVVGRVAWSYVEIALGTRGQVVGAPIPPGSIGLLAHGASWDVGLLALGRAVPTTVFVNVPTARWAARFITRQRAAAGLELLPPHGSFGRAREALAEGRLVVFALDQRHNRGVPASFLGRPAWTSAGFAVLAHETGAPVFGLWPTLDARGRHVLQVEPVPIDRESDRQHAIPALTNRALAWYAGRIRADPGGWWWLHRRWKVPAGSASGPDPDGGVHGA